MRRIVLSLALAVLVGASTSCGSEAPRSDTGVVGCTPGEQVACACPGSAIDGVQVCDATGAGFGACLGCGGATDDASSGVTSTDTATTIDATTDMSATTPLDSSGPGAEASDVTGPPAGTETGADAFAWVWVDHGGPAFLPPPCAAAAGVADGLLVDPQAFFESLVAGADPDDWQNVMNAIEPQLWACGVGQQRDSGGNVRGRLFLPIDSCPNAAPPPDDPEAMFLGVRQERACWMHFVDVVSEL